MTHYVYVLKSLKDNRRYIGLTNDLERRLSQHNSGKVTATKSRLPMKLIYTEKYYDRSIAAEREKYLKSGIGRKFLDKNT